MLIIFCLICFIAMGFIIYSQIISYNTIRNRQKLFIINELTRMEDKVYMTLESNDQKLIEITINEFKFYVNFYKKHFGIDDQYLYWLNKLNEIMAFSE